MKAAVYYKSGNPDVYPVFKSTCLVRRASARLPTPLDGANVRFFAFARTALAAGLGLLGLKPGDNVLLPSFMCDVVMAPFVELSIEPRFYDLDEKLGPDLDAAQTLLDGRTRALMAVNYFGFAPDFEAIRGFCDEHGLYFVEDNAHGFLSRRGERPLGTFGDIAIESFRKILGLLDGAALLVNAPGLDCARLPVDRADPPLNPALNLFRSILASVKALTGIDALAPAGRLYDKMRAVKPSVPANGRGPRSEEISLLNCRQRWSGLSEAVVRRIRPEEIVSLHREGFRSWLRWFASEGATGVRPLFEELAPGIVPLAFPVVGRGYDRIEELLKQLNVGWNKWPPFLPHASPGWRFFDRVLLLPVHCRLRLPTG